MKNKIFKAALATMAAASMVACSDYLDRTPLDSNSDATNWTSESALETYSWNLTENLKDLSYGSGSGKGQYHSEAYCDDYTTDGFTQFLTIVPGSSSAWNTPYDRIRMANILLARVDQVPNLSDEAANHWRGVARFFRALYHFQLVRSYGDVVWVDSEIDFAKEENVTRSRDSRVVVMDNVVADLKFAMENCRAAAGPDIVVNNMVAAALLSRAALYEGAFEKYHNVAGGHPEQYYQAAKEAAAKVIDSGKYAIGNDYKKTYTSVSLAGNKEVIMYKIYTFANVNGGKTTVANSIAGWSNSSTPTLGLTKSAVENYATADGLPIYMGEYSDKTLESVFSNRDKRLSATVDPEHPCVPGMAYEYGIVSTSAYWTWKFVPWERKDEMQKNSTWAMPSNDIDGPVFLYSEVLENYAEACAELGSCSQADLDKSVNVLRINHGGMPALTVSGTEVSVNGTAITKDPKDPAANVLLQEIRRDRRSELMCDGFRHDDLMRWKLGENLDFAKNPDGFVGASQELLKNYYDSKNWGEGASWDDVLIGSYWLNGYKASYAAVGTATEGSKVQAGNLNRVWEDKQYLLPIPSGQITLDPNISQNQGW